MKMNETNGTLRVVGTSLENIEKIESLLGHLGIRDEMTPHGDAGVFQILEPAAK